MDLPEARALPAEVFVTRGDRVESVHRVAVAVVDVAGRLQAAWGDPAREVLYRSAAKPLQALPLVEDGVVERLGLEAEELAVCCGSHGGEPRHLVAVRSILRKAGLGEAALACGPHLPLRKDSAEGLLAEGRQPSAVHNNCSGKHAAMLALAVAKGWEVEGYQRPDHPVQRRMLAEISRWSGVPEGRVGTSVDGCGVTCFAVPLHRMALSFARFAEAAGRGEPAARIVSAMREHPFMVAGTGRLCTLLLRAAGDRVFAKTGAEGVYCAGLPGEGLGVALKVLDGGRRAADAALLHVLELLGIREAGEVEELRELGRPAVRNTRGEVVGQVRVTLGGGELRSGEAPSGDLTRADALLVDVAAAMPTGRAASLETALRAALAGGVAPGAVEEVLLQGYLFLGYPRTLHGFALWREVTGRPAGVPAPEDWEGWKARGEAVCRRVYGRQFEALKKNVRALHADLENWMVTEGYGKVLGRPELPLRTRELCVAALLAVLDAPAQLRSHLRGALNAGATAEEVESMLARSLRYSGGEASRRALETWGIVRSRWRAGAP